MTFNEGTILSRRSPARKRPGPRSPESDKKKEEKTIALCAKNIQDARRIRRRRDLCVAHFFLHILRSEIFFFLCPRARSHYLRPALSPFFRASSRNCNERARSQTHVAAARARTHTHTHRVHCGLKERKKKGEKAEKSVLLFSAEPCRNATPSFYGGSSSRIRRRSR